MLLRRALVALAAAAGVWVFAALDSDASVVVCADADGDAAAVDAPVWLSSH